MKYKINKGIINQKQNDKITIFDGNRSVLYHFNETASLIFEMLKRGKAENEIISSVKKRFNVDEKIIKRDMDVFLKNLKKIEVISLPKQKKQQKVLQNRKK